MTLHLSRAGRIALVRRTLSAEAWALWVELLAVQPEPMTMSALADYLPTDHLSTFSDVVQLLHARRLVEFPAQGFVQATDPAHWQVAG